MIPEPLGGASQAVVGRELGDRSVNPHGVDAEPHGGHQADDPHEARRERIGGADLVIAGPPGDQHECQGQHRGEGGGGQLLRAVPASGEPVLPGGGDDARSEPTLPAAGQAGLGGHERGGRGHAVERLGREVVQHLLLERPEGVALAPLPAVKTTNSFPA